MVVMDQEMGNSDGLDVLREIRKQFRAFPLVLCTAYCAQCKRQNPRIVDFHATKTLGLKDLKEKNPHVASQREFMGARGSGPCKVSKLSRNAAPVRVFPPATAR